MVPYISSQFKFKQLNAAHSYNSLKQKSLAERPTALQTLLLVGFIRINIGFQLARVIIEEHKVVAIDAMRFSTDH